MNYSNIQKGQTYKYCNNDVVWVRFIFETIDGIHYLEYTPNGVVPHQVSDEPMGLEGWTEISYQEAQKLIHNMEEQDKNFCYRLSKKAETESLAKAMEILENKEISSIYFADNAVKIITSEYEYEIYFTPDGIASRRCD